MIVFGKAGRSVRAALVGGALLALAGCVGLYIPPMPAGYQFDQKDDWGIVIYAMAPTQPPPEVIRDMILEWNRYDVAKQTIIAPPAKTVPMWLTSGHGFDAMAPEKRTEMRYTVARMPPGDYVLSTIVVDFRDRPGGAVTVKRTVLFGDPAHPTSSPHALTSDAQRSVAGHVAPRFTVKAGEIVYVGDYRVDIEKFPAAITAVELNVAGAREELARHPGIKGDMKTGIGHLSD